MRDNRSRSSRRMKWKKDHKLPNTKSKLPDQLPAASTSSGSSSPHAIKREEEDDDDEDADEETDLDAMHISHFIKEESFSPHSSN